MTNNNDICFYDNDAAQRLDLYLLGFFPGCSRSFIQKTIDNGVVKVNDKTAKASHRLKKGDAISYNCFDFIDKHHLPDKLKPLDFKLDLVFEDDNVIIIDKPAGIAVHPSIGNEDNTLVNALINYNESILNVVHDHSSKLSSSRPGIVHRLDKDTSGIIMIAKNLASLKYLSAQIRNKKVKKTYRAICFGWPINSCDRLINYLGRSSQNRLMHTEVGSKKGRESIADYKVINCLKDIKNHKFSYVEFDLITGRTHQIRAQSLLLGNPIIGDKLYHTKESFLLSSKLSAGRQMLHAYKLQLTLQGDSKPTEFSATTPKDFSKIISDSIIT